MFQFILNPIHYLEYQNLYRFIFQNLKIRENEFLLTIENLTNIDKAKILYNHFLYWILKAGFSVFSTVI